MQITNVQEHKHLTATERKAIVAILEAGLMEGKVGRKVFRITKLEEGFKVMIESKRSNDYGKMIDVTYSATFNVK